MTDQDRPNEIANTRVAVTPSTLARLRDFTAGLGSANNDEAINVLLDLAIEMTKKEGELLAGYELRKMRNAKDVDAGIRNRQQLGARLRAG